MLITGNILDLILINKVLPKAHSTYMSSFCQVDIPDYFHFSNFDPDHIEQPAGLSRICIYVSNKLVPTSGVARSMVILGPKTEVIGQSGSRGLGCSPQMLRKV